MGETLKSLSTQGQPRKLLPWAIFALVAATCIAGDNTARADTTDELIERLRAKGILSPAEVKKLKQRHAAEVAAQAEKLRHTPPQRQLVTKEGVVTAPDDHYVTVLDKKGIGVRIGNVDVSLAGDVTFFGTEVLNPKKGPLIDGSLMGSAENSSFSLRGGLPPSAFIVSLASNQSGYDLSATLGIYTGGTNSGVGLLNANSPGAAVALGTPGVDIRQIFGTIGRPDFGTVKIGRDVGIFGADAIFNDDTIFGSGIPYFNAAPRNSTLGRIGYGYVYADFMPQITYTSPDYHGFTGTIGVMSPLEEFNFSGDSGAMSGHDQPMLQGRLKYVGFVADNVKLTAWTSGLTQQQRVEYGDNINLAPGTSIRASAVDGGMRLDLGRASVLASGYYGVGLGTSALFFDGVTVNGVKRVSYGGYAQASYLLTDRFKVGASWGISGLEAVYGDPQTLIKSADAYVGFARYKLTDWFTLEAEYVHSKSLNQFGQSIQNNAIILGSTFVF
jgi:hypothetical protein